MSFDIKKAQTRLQKAVNESALSIREIEKRSGVTRSTIQRYLTGDISKMPVDKFKAIADAIGVPPEYILGWEDASPELLPIKKKKFQILGEIACGQPIFTNEEHDTYINASADINADFCLIAKGDSMVEDRIYNGDVVFIKSASIVPNGCIAAVVIDDEATLKRWYFYPQEKKLVLVPANNKYAPMVYVGQELNKIRCIGRAVCFMSNL